MSDLKRITQLAEELLKLELAITELEEQTKALKEAHRKIQEGDLPEMMEAAGVETFTLSSGRSVSLSVETYANISKENEETAFSWLRDHGHDALIRRELSVSFGKGEDRKANRLFKYLSARKYLSDNSIIGKQSVHPATLRAFVRRCLEAGEEIPQDTFGIFQRTVAKIGSAPGAAAKKKAARKES